MSKPVISTKTTKMLYRNKLNARQLAVFSVPLLCICFIISVKAIYLLPQNQYNKPLVFQVRSLALFSPQLPLYMLQGNLSMGS